jgi:hypothetical protein
MASDIYVTFGGDTAGLEASAATAKAAINALARDLASLSRQMQNTGAAADSELGQKVLATATKLTVARTGLAGIKSDLAGLAAAGGFAEVGAAAEKGAVGVEVSTREISHAIHGMAELAMGETGRAKNAMIGLAVQLGAANPALIGIGAAALAGAGGLAYFAYQATTASKAAESINNAALVAQVSMTKDESAKLRDTLASLAGVSDSAAVEIARAFLAIGQGGPQIAEISSAYLPMLADALGVKAPEAAKKLAEMFAELGTKGRAYVADTAGVSAATIKSYDAFVAAGENGKAYILIIEAMRSRLEESRAAAVAEAAATALAHVARGAALGSVEALSGAERAQATVVSAAVEKYNASIAALDQLTAALQNATPAADAFSRALDTALKLDKVGSDIAKTTGEIERMKAELAKATAKGDATGAAELSKGIAIAEDELKKYQQQASDGLLGRSAVAQTKEQLTEIEQTFKGSTVAMLQQQRAAIADRLAGDNLDAAARHQLELDLAAKDKEVRDAADNAANASDERRVLAAGKNAAAIVAIRQQEVAREIAGYGEGSERAMAAERQLAEAKRQAAEQGAAAARSGAKDEISATVEKVNSEVGLIEKATADKIALYAKEAEAKQITEAVKVALTMAALQQGLAAEQAALQAELANDNLTLAAKQKILDKIKEIQQANADAVVKIQEDAAAKTAQFWNSAMDKINGAVDSQVDGLLRGTTTWGQALKNVLASATEDVIKFFLNWGLKTVEQQILSLASNNAMTAGLLSALAVQTAAQTGAAATGAATAVAAKAPVVASDAGQAGAGVAAFLAPLIGPAAIPAGQAAAGETLAIGSADIGMWDVPRDQLTLVHQRELVATPSQANAIRSLPDLLSGGAPGAGQGAGGGDVHLHYAPSVQAIDATGVAALLANHGRELAGQLAQVWNANPSLRPSY